MRICFIVGTRPEIIKMSPVVKECLMRGLDFFVLHTGQHYDFVMDKIFFNEFGLEPPLVNLKIGSGSHAEMTGRMLLSMEETIVREKPNVVLVQGDTDTALAGALIATKLHLPVGHVEAGLRSYDRRMPEEYNRIICDHVARY